MRGTTKVFGFLLGGLALGLSGSVHAQSQAPTVTLTDIVGTWEQVPDRSTGQRERPDSSVIYRAIVIRPDSVLLDHRIQIFNGDTLSCRSPWGSKATRYLLNQFSLDHGAGGVPQLIMGWKGDSGAPGQREVFKRVDSATSRYAHIVAAGFALGGRPVPAHPSKPSGTLADLFGTWEATSGKTRQGKTWAEVGTVKDVMIFRSDTTLLGVQTHVEGKDTVACGQELVVPSLQRIGDSIFLFRRDAAGDGYILHNQQLAYYPGDRFVPDSVLKKRDSKLTPEQVEPFAIYQAVAAPKRP